MMELDEEEVADLHQKMAATVTLLVNSATGAQQCECLEELVVCAKLLQGRPVPEPVPLVKALRPLLSSSVSYVRTAALRCMRHFVEDPHFIAMCWRYKLDWWVARAMDRQKNDRERETAFRFVRALVDAIADAGRLAWEEHELPPRELAARQGSAVAVGGDAEPRLPFLFPALGSRSSVTSLDASAFLSPSMDFGRMNKSISAEFSRSPSRITSLDCRNMEVPLSILQRIISVAETADDTLRRKCVLMLRDLVPFRVRTLSQTHGVRALLQAMVDPRLGDVSPSLVLSLLWIVDPYPTRKHLRLNLDLQTLVPAFTEKPGKDAKELAERMKAARAAVLTLLRTWAGLICLANDPHCLRALIDVLHAPGPAYRKNLLFELFTQAIVNAAPHRVIPEYISPSGFSGERGYDEATRGPEADAAPEPHPAASSVRRHWEGAASMSFNEFSEAGADHNLCAELAPDHGRRAPTQTYAGYNALDTFLGALLLALDHSGLTSTLVSLVYDPTDDLVSVQAAKLLHLMFSLTDTLFPKRFSLRLHGSFDVVLAAMIKASRRVLSTYRDHPPEDAEVKDRQSETLEERQATQQQNHKVLSMVTALHQSLLDTQRQSVGRSLPLGEGLPFQMAVMVDDTQFKILLSEAYILATKDFTRWNTERILLLIRGPLRSHPRFLEALKTKFFKRILSFLRPSKRLFAEMPYREENFIWSLIGCRVIDLLLLSGEGTRYLLNSQLLIEIHACLEAELSGKGDAPLGLDRIFNKERIAHSMSREYIRFLGRCTENANGMELLQSLHLLKTLAALTETGRGREDLCHQILKFMNFGRVDNAGLNEYKCRMLENAMKDGSKPIRLFATLQLRNCLHVEKGMADPLNIWCVDRLLAQLEDRWRDVAHCAYQTLSECSQVNTECLIYIINKNPSVDKLAEYPGQALLLRMLHTAEGFRFLRAQGWVEAQVRHWREEGSQQYVYALEADIQKAMSASNPVGLGERPTPTPKSRPSICISGGSFSTDFPTPATSLPTCAMPAHFYAELCATPEGLEYFKATHIFDDLCTVVDRSTAAAPHVEEEERTETPGEQGAEDSDEDAPVNLSFEMFHECGDQPTHQKESIRRMLQEADTETQYTGPKAEVLPGRKEGVFCTQPLPSWYAPMAHPPTKSIRVATSLPLRSAVWALGHLGSTEHGLPLLLQANLVERLAQLASYADCLSFRGTAMAVLGLVGRSEAGRQELRRCGWETHASCDGYVGSDSAAYSVSLAYPIQHRPLFMLPEVKLGRQSLMPIIEWSSGTRRKAGVRIRVPLRDGDPGGETATFTGVLHTAGAEDGPGPQGQLTAAILKAVRALSNPVMQDQASKELKRIRQQTPSAFQSPLLAADVYTLMSVYRYRPNVRRFLYDFFDSLVFTSRALDKIDAAHGLGGHGAGDQQRKA